MSTPYILVVDDEPDIRETVQDILTDEGYDVAVADCASTAKSLVAERTPSLVLLDIWMPDEDGISLLKQWREAGELTFPVVMMSGHGNVETAVEATRLGAIDFVEKPLSLAKLLAIVEKALQSDAVQQGAPEGAQQTPLIPDLVGNGSYARTLRESAARVASSDVAVLISGQAASGKSTLAYYIHRQSTRQDKPFITLRGDTLDEQTLAVDLFGSEFRGAISKGLLERAQGGTLYISDITELSSAAQTLLQSSLETETFTRVGGSRDLTLDIRLICSTTEEMSPLVQAGEFRQDLYYLVNVASLATQSLRDHREDIPVLLEYYVNWFTEHENLPYRHFNLAAQNRLRNYDWPGNVSELRNFVQRLMVMGDGHEIALEDVEELLASHQPSSAPVMPDQSHMAIPLHLPLREARAEFERIYLTHQLDAVDGSIGDLARRVGMERTHLYRKLRSLGVETGKGRS